MVKKMALEDKAKRALHRRLRRERNVYGIIGKPVEIKLDKAYKSQYDGKGDAFEAFVKFDDYPHIGGYLIVLYGGGKSDRIYEL